MTSRTKPLCLLAKAIPYLFVMSGVVFTLWCTSTVSAQAVRQNMEEESATSTPTPESVTPVSQESNDFLQTIAFTNAAQPVEPICGQVVEVTSCNQKSSNFIFYPCDYNRTKPEIPSLLLTSNPVRKDAYYRVNDYIAESIGPVGPLCTNRGDVVERMTSLSPLEPIGSCAECGAAPPQIPPITTGSDFVVGDFHWSPPPEAFKSFSLIINIQNSLDVESYVPSNGHYKIEVEFRLQLGDPIILFFDSENQSSAQRLSPIKLPPLKAGGETQIIISDLTLPTSVTNGSVEVRFVPKDGDSNLRNNAHIKSLTVTGLPTYGIYQCVGLLFSVMAGEVLTTDPNELQTGLLLDMWKNLDVCYRNDDKECAADQLSQMTQQAPDLLATVIGATGSSIKNGIGCSLEVVNFLTSRGTPISTLPIRPLIGLDAAWEPSLETFDKINECGITTQNECVLSIMRETGASPKAIVVAQQIGNEGYLADFQDIGTVDLGVITYPLAANSNFGNPVLLNGVPPIIVVNDHITEDELSRNLAIQKDPVYSSLATQFPEIMMDTVTSFETAQQLSSGGQRFIFRSLLLNGCRACEQIGIAHIALDFDGMGKFLGIRLLSIEPLSKENPAPTDNSQQTTEWIAYIDKEDVGNIWMATIDGQERRQLTFDGNNRHPVWSSDGTHLLYEHGSELYLLHVESGERLLVAADACCPAWSPSGDAIAFFSATSHKFEVSRPNGSERKEVCCDGSLDAAPLSDPTGPMFWGPEDTLASFTQNSLLRIDPNTGSFESLPIPRNSDYKEGSDIRSLTAGGACLYGPALPPDFHYMAFTIDTLHCGDFAPGGYAVVFIDLFSGVIEAGMLDLARPSWSPDSTRVAVEVYTEAVDTPGATLAGIALMDFPGNVGPVIIDGGTQPAWRPMTTDSVTSSESSSTLESGEDYEDTNTVSPVQTFAPELGLTWDVAFSPSGAILAAATESGLWFTPVTADSATVLATTNPLSSLSWSPDGTRLATGVGAVEDAENSVGLVYLWDIATGAPSATFDEPEAAVISVAWSPDGAFIAAGAADERVYIWDVATGELRTMLGQEANVTSISWSADSSLLAAAGDDGVVQIWQPVTGENVLTINAHPDGATQVRWSPDGTMLATSGEDEALVLWDASSGAPRLQLDDLGSAITSLAWSPDSTMIATATQVTDENSDESYSLRVWDVASGELRHTLTGHTRPVTGLSWSPTGAQLAASARDGTVLLWTLITNAGS